MTPPQDELAGLINPASQQEAATLAQDGFTRIFRLLVEGDEAAAELGLALIETRAREWAAREPDAAPARLALLVSGLDQWGLALCQAFDLQALPGLTTLLGNLRNALDAQATAKFEQAFTAIEAREENAIDFKMALRRGIHLALWHALAASEEAAEQARLTQQLGSLMLALVRNMPNWGGHLLADSLAHLQLRLLQSASPNPAAEAATATLFESLQQTLGAAAWTSILNRAAQLVIAYQAAQRNAATATATEEAQP